VLDGQPLCDLGTTPVVPSPHWGVRLESVFQDLAQAVSAYWCMQSQIVFIVVSNHVYVRECALAIEEGRVAVGLQPAELENRDLMPGMRGRSRLTGAVSRGLPDRYGQDAMSWIRWRLSVRGRGRYRESHLCRGDTAHVATVAESVLIAHGSRARSPARILASSASA